MLTRENAIASIIAADSAQNFPVMASSDVELLINQIYDEHEALMKAKDEKIVELKLEVFNSFPKIANTKTRKIVAMLFWEWKYAKRLSENNKYTEGFIYGLKVSFEKAYSILKGNA